MKKSFIVMRKSFCSYSFDFLISKIYLNYSYHDLTYQSPGFLKNYYKNNYLSFRYLLTYGKIKQLSYFIHKDDFFDFCIQQHNKK